MKMKFRILLLQVLAILLNFSGLSLRAEELGERELTQFTADYNSLEKRRKSLQDEVGALLKNLTGSEKGSGDRTSDDAAPNADVPLLEDIYELKQHRRSIQQLQNEALSLQGKVEGFKQFEKPRDELTGSIPRQIPEPDSSNPEDEIQGVSSRSAEQERLSKEVRELAASVKDLLSSVEVTVDRLQRNSEDRSMRFVSIMHFRKYAGVAFAIILLVCIGVFCWVFRNGVAAGGVVALQVIAAVFTFLLIALLGLTEVIQENSVVSVLSGVVGYILGRVAHPKGDEETEAEKKAKQAAKDAQAAKDGQDAEEEGK